MARPRSICFTLNNYSEAEKVHIQNGIFKFVIFQEEVGAGGTPHLQGYAQLAQPTSFARWKQLVGARAHIEGAKGSAQANIDYCTKLTDRIAGTHVFERGARPSQGDRTDLTAICAAAVDPKVTLASIIALDAPNFLRFHKGVMAIKTILAPKRSFKSEVFWFYGGTGTGKSHRARELSGDRSFWKQNSPWWCGYDPIFDETVVIDEYRGDFSKFSFLLQLFDQYPLLVQVKGAQLQFSARRIIITSPKSPAETWSTRTAEDIYQLLRRITVVCEFLPGRVIRFEKGLPEQLVPLVPLEEPQPVGVVLVAAQPEPLVPAVQPDPSPGVPFERVVRARTGLVLGDEPPVGIPLSQSSFIDVFDNMFDFDNEIGNAPSHVEHFNI